jgi:hypothetical protein
MPPNPRSIRYPLIAVLSAAAVLLLLYFMDGPRPQIVTSEEAQTVIRNDTPAKLWIMQSHSGDQRLVIQPQGTKQFLMTRMDPTLSRLLQERHADVKMSIEGKDWAILGRPGKLLPLLCVFIIAAGAVVVIRRKVT